MDLANYRAEATLRDGAPVIIRALRPEDRAALVEGFQHLSERTVYHRFFQAKRELTETELKYLTDLDFRDHIGLVAELPPAAGTPGAGPQLIAVGRAVRTGGWSVADKADKMDRAVKADRKTAEVAFVVGDEFQGRGVGTLLLEHLARMARELGYHGFVAEVLADNRLMLEVFEHSGLPSRERVRDGVMHVEMDL